VTSKRTGGAHNSARIIAVVGASGMGKGRYIKTELLPTFRGPVMVWSPLEKSDNYAAILGVPAVSDLGSVIAAWRAGKSSVFVPPLNPKTIAAVFSLFCRAAWHMPGAVILVEELSRVTSPSYAPPAWRDLSTAGRHQGLTLVGTCQRPAQVDKDFFGNCTEIRCLRVNYENDARVMADILRVDQGSLRELPKFGYVHRVMDERRNVAGVLGESLPAQPKIKVSKPKPRNAANRGE
jgi:hypothetical protein